MKKQVGVFSVLLALVLLAGGCTPGGKSVSLTDAQIAISAIFVMGADTMDPAICPILGIPTSALLVRQSASGSLRYELAPNDGLYPFTETITVNNYADSNFGYYMTGTTVTTTTALDVSSTIYNLSNMSSPMSKVTSVTGTMTSTGATNGGTLYFNGEPYTLAELGL
jgi:hypothetical protein